MANLVVKGKAVFTNDNGEQFTVKPNELDWECEVHDEDRGMGAEFVHIAEFEVDGHDVELLVYEYPEGIVNLVDVNKEGLSLDENFKFSFEYERDDD